jgi:dual specificity tyrosine-phosphorylation-regulated kinase 2/3/4
MSATSALLESQREHELHLPFTTQGGDKKIAEEDDGLDMHQVHNTQVLSP